MVLLTKPGVKGVKGVLLVQSTGWNSRGMTP